MKTQSMANCSISPYFRLVTGGIIPDVTLISSGVERGVNIGFRDYDLTPFGRDPRGRILQIQITPLLVSLVWSFYFTS